MARLTLVCLLMFVTQPRFQELELEPLPDYYATLNVSPKATLREIKKSFRKLAQFYHPDKNKDETAQEIFKDLSEAYSVLSDKEKKAEYDELFFFEMQYREEQSPPAEEEYPEEFPSEEGQVEPEETLEPEEPEPEHQEEDVPLTEEAPEKQAESDVWDDLDDEALFKVLKFLADHDYEITKRKVYKETESNHHSDHSRTRRSADTNTFSGGPTYRSYTQTGEERTYTPSTHTYHHHKPEYQRRHEDRGHQTHGRDHHRGEYKFDRYRSSGPQYCRTYVSYEGNVKITQKTCY